MTSPTEREFTIFNRGEVREEILRGFREGLRDLVDPETGQTFTEDTIRRATGPGTRFWVEAESIDIVGLGIQKRAEFFAQQVRLDRAGSAMLRNYHGVLWGEEALPAFGASGTVTANATPGTTWVGSTTLPDPFAVVGRDDAGNRYQAFVSALTPGSGVVTLTLVGLDGGDATNLEVGDKITWVNPPLGAAPTALVATEFAGGTDEETDSDFGDRLASRVRNKPGAGNWAQLRAFARSASAAVDAAWVYPVAFHAGSVLVAVTQKRGLAVGPLARIPSISVLAAVTGLLVPPGSPVFPARAFVLVVGPTAEPSDLVLQTALPKASAAGWTDLVPFPPVDGTDGVEITTVSTQTSITISLPTAGAGLLPGGVAGPLTGVNLMVWDADTSSFEKLLVSTVTDIGGGDYTAVLSSPPTHFLTAGDWISPDSERRDAIASGLVSYFDQLGPGEVIDLTTDPRAPRAYRHPTPSEEDPSRAGQAIVTFLSDALGSSLSDATLASITVQTPTLPTEPALGPRLLVPGLFAVYDLP